MHGTGTGTGYGTGIGIGGALVVVVVVVVVGGGGGGGGGGTGHMHLKKLAMHWLAAVQKFTLALKKLRTDPPQLHGLVWHAQT